MSAEPGARGRPGRVTTFVAGVALGAVAGAGAMLVGFPFLFPPEPLFEAPPTGIVPGSPASTFRFDRDARGRDELHWADGSGTLVRTGQGWVLRLEQDFEAGPGPDYWIFLNTRAVSHEDDFHADTGAVRVARLRSFAGAQNYPLPADLDPTRFHTVTIWCRTFGQYIGSGTLTAALGTAPRR